MKKIRIHLIIISFINMTYGNYYIKIPLEVEKGGSLPNESVSFKNKNILDSESPVTLPPQPECKYDYPNNYWLNGRNNAYNIVHVLDNGVKVYDGKNIRITTQIIDNYKYTRGDFIGNFGNYQHHYVCKIGI